MSVAGHDQSWKDRIASWFQQRWQLVGGLKLERDQGFYNESRWAQNYTPQTDGPYELARQHAERKFDLAIQAFNAEDKKSEIILGFSSTAAVLLIAAARGNLFQANVPTVVGIILIFLSAIAACRGRVGGAVISPSSARELLEIIDSEPSLSESHLESLVAATNHVAIEGTRRMAHWKARLVRIAYVLFVAGVGALILNLF